jgi:hypothetical protein
VRFSGSDYDHTRDADRLDGQLLRIWSVMASGEWKTLAEISALTGDPPASVSAQLRHLRKERFGSHQVQKIHLGRGLYRYRVVPNPQGLSPPELKQLEALLA